MVLRAVLALRRPVWRTQERARDLQARKGLLLAVQAPRSAARSNEMERCL